MSRNKNLTVDLKDFQSASGVPESVIPELNDLIRNSEYFRYMGEHSETAKLEREFAKIVGTKYALALNSCSSAIFISLKCFQIDVCSNVLMPAFTFAAVPSAIVHAGGKPVLVEVGDNYRVDLEDFKSKMDKDIKAVLISHMRGHTSDMKFISELCIERKTPLIEDAAHSLGATLSGKNVGTYGDVGCYSFQSYKLINGGEGGMLVTNDEELYAKAVIMSGAYESSWKKHPFESKYFEKYQNKIPVYNMRMNNVSALLIRTQLDSIQERAKIGRDKVNELTEYLTVSPFIDFPKKLNEEVQAPDSLQFNLVGFSEIEACKLLDKVREEGVSLNIFGLQEGNARAFWNWEFIDNIPSLPKTEKMLKKACDIRVPLNFESKQIKKVAQVILQSIDFVKSNN